jgi:sugar phosphate isomerase/epimerase
MELTPSYVNTGMLPLLKEHGIEVPGVYLGGGFHTVAEAERSVAQMVEQSAIAKSMGARYIVTNPNPKHKGEAKTAEELSIQAKYVGQLAEKLHSNGLRLLLHHHAPEMANNAHEWRHLLANTDAKLVGMCMDTDWIAQGGQQMLPILKEAGNRVEVVHLRNAAEKIWTESVDQGDYDYKAVADHLRSIGFQGYLVVELAHRPDMKITRSLEENLRISREYVEKTFGVTA